MKTNQLFVLFITFIAFCVTNVNAENKGTASYRKKVRAELDRKCNEEIMKKNFITINDKIVCDKTIQSVTKSYMKKICPKIIELTLKDTTEHYLTEGLTKEEYQDYVVKNISEAYMREVYTEQNFPTYRPNMTLVININDIYTYEKNHCQYYFVDLKNHKEHDANTNKYKQEVTNHFSNRKNNKNNNDNTVTIETTPSNNPSDHYDFQTVLCPTIEELLVTNVTRLSSNKLMNKILIVQKISKEFMNKVYTEANFKEAKIENARLKSPSLEDIYHYYQNHCRRVKIQNETYYMQETLCCISCVFYLMIIVSMLLGYNIFKMPQKIKGTIYCTDRNEVDKNE